MCTEFLSLATPLFRHAFFITAAHFGSLTEQAQPDAVFSFPMILFSSVNTTHRKLVPWLCAVAHSRYLVCTKHWSLLEQPPSELHLRSSGMLTRRRLGLFYRRFRTTYRSQKSVNTYQSRLRNNPEERRSHMKSRITLRILGSAPSAWQYQRIWNSTKIFFCVILINEYSPNLSVKR